jgi:PAS domain S-box-containing protein
MNFFRHFRQLRSPTPSGEAISAGTGYFAHPALAAKTRVMEACLSGLFEVVWIKDLQGKYAWVNDTFVERTDLPRDAVIGHTSEEIAMSWPHTSMGSNQKRLEFLIAEDRRVLDGQGEIDSTDEISAPGGHKLWLRSIKLPLKDDKGNIVGLLGYSHDVTLETQNERKRQSLNASLQSKLHEQESMAAGAAQLMRLGWAKWQHEEERYSYVDEVYAAIHGYSQEEFMHHFSVLSDDAALIHPEDRVATLAFARTESTEPTTHDYRIIDRSGEIVFVRENVLPSISTDGVVGESVITLQDVTQWKKTEQRLRKQASQAKEARALSEAIFRNLTHELKTPLNGILGGLNNVEIDHLTETNLRLRMLMSENAKKLSESVEDLLQLTRSQSQKTEDRRVSERVCIADMVYQVIAHAVGDAEKAGLTLRVELEIDHAVKHSSGAELRTALRKYLENAINFSGGGEVVVAVSRIEATGEPAQLKFCVTDQGTGIGAEDQKRVFEAYFKADSALKGGQGGAGMGLAIVKLLMHSMGGEVGVESTPGEGSQFWFTVPQY